MVPLLLQQPAGKSSYRDNAEHLEKRLQLWEAGQIRELVAESTTIQKELEKSTRIMDDATLAMRFATMVF